MERHTGDARRRGTGTVIGTNWKQWAAELKQAKADDDKDELERRRAELDAALKTNPLYVGTKLDSLDHALAEAAAAADSDAALAVLRTRLSVRIPPFRGIMAGHGDDKPVPLIRGRGLRGYVLSEGEVAVLSGAGGIGKSTIAMQIALAGALADAAGADWGETSGLSVRAGRSVILSWEDSAWRLAERASKALGLPALKKLAGRLPAGTESGVAANERVQASHMRGWPLWGVGEGDHALTRPTALDAWDAAWRCIREFEPSLVVIDPAMSAYIADSNSVAFVRSFLDSLYGAAKEARCGVLLVAHSTKGAQRTKDADRTGDVAGSAGWTDAARGVLTMRRPTKGEGDITERTLECTKANYSRSFSRSLEEHRAGASQEFCGFEETTKAASASIGKGARRNGSKYDALLEVDV